MKTCINMDSWNRREHFLFFGSFTDPFFGITVNVDFTSTYQEAKTNQDSFFLYSLHRIMKAVNEVTEFRYRTEDERVVCFDAVHVGTTIGREDGTFGFGFIEYASSRERFILNAKEEIERVKNLSGLCFDDNAARLDIIRFSPVPWFAFTEMKHASSFMKGDSAPRISTGKLIKENGRLLLPMNITAHHGLMDGKHVAELLDRLR